ncbi:TonB-dependent receptor [Pseudoduganella ginsengisoli]|uniref:TonB-dependent receptor n=1 Tax=Pseudoduganella ginsengisoli TaxID=1462440 RepID=A0A6L6Q834_9BURK|nr:TonB-dependent receptor [Pseudoduganella ginsengisoli]MTW05378.1 TonB-dependent receptor [Pseudoduganella ginsengisoli]
MTLIPVRLKPLHACLLAALCSTSWQASAQTQALVAGQADAATTAVTITGSRIPRASVEGPSPVTVISAEDITRQGYKNVFDALNSLTQNSGFVQGADFGNTFTPSANAISLRGLGPNHTLVLLNGRRLADFPIAYEGTVNFTNLANIPAAVIERIEVLNGGASAIYGSDAIAGVVNVVLKKRADGIEVNAKAGATSRGGGGDRRVQLAGGAQRGQLDTVFAIELSERDPLSSLERDFMARRGGTPTNILSRRDIKSNKYLDLGNTCASLSDLFGGSTISYTAGKRGSYCASPAAAPTHWTVQTGNRSANAYGSANYAAGDDHTLFADFLLSRNDSWNNTRGPNWTSASTGSSYFYNRNRGAYEAWTRFIAPEEYGGVDRYNRTWDDDAVAVTLGARGRLPGTRWDYEAAYSASLYRSSNHVPRALANIDSFFLGPKLGADSAGIPIYAPDPARLTSRLTPAEFDSITGQSDSRDASWTNTLSFAVNGEWLQLPAGPIKLAAIAEAGRQGYTNKPDARINQGYFNTNVPTVDTGGTRSRAAVGVEANIPLIKEVAATVAGRYDRYEFAGRSDGRFTYNGGLEWRPAPALLVRATHATSFRAPDMNYIYKARGTGYYSSTTDYYRCALAGQAIDQCDYANVSPGADYVQIGSRDLKSEKGKSSGLGLVWSPSAAFDTSLDYWRFKIDGLVTNLSADQLLRDEAKCRLGQSDITSPTCVDTLARIQRYPLTALNKPGEIKEIRVNPINAASQETSGMDATVRYALRGTGWGDFTLRANYSKTLVQRYQQFNGDPVEDRLHALDSTDWPDKLGASLAWTAGRWTNTLSATRYGKIPNSAGTAYLSPTTLANWSAVYRYNERLTLSAIVNNVFNKIKRDDTGGWPYYPVGNYSPVGRIGWVEVNYRFN